MKALLLILTLACAGCVSPEAKPEPKQEGQAAEKGACPKDQIPKDPFIRLLYLLAAVASIHR